MSARARASKSRTRTKARPRFVNTPSARAGSPPAPRFSPRGEDQRRERQEQQEQTGEELSLAREVGESRPEPGPHFAQSHGGEPVGGERRIVGHVLGAADEAEIGR